MSKHLAPDIESLEQELLAMSALVEEMIDKGSRALRHRSAELAREVIECDDQADRREVHIEEECLKILALHQPVAIDLRRTATNLKINNDLERIADLAVSIARRAHSLDHYRDFEIPDPLERMVRFAVTMVHGALDAFVNLNPEMAAHIVRQDDEVDEDNLQVISELYQVMRKDPDQIEPALHCFSAARQVERIADHATNIAEDVIYLVKGHIARHGHNIEVSAETS